MKITIEMNVEEYDEYREYQKKSSKQLKLLQSIFNDMQKAIKIDDDSQLYYIEDSEALERVLETLNYS